MPPLVVGHLPPGWRKEGEPVSHEKKGTLQNLSLEVHKEKNWSWEHVLQAISSFPLFFFPREGVGEEGGEEENRKSFLFGGREGRKEGIRNLKEQKILHTEARVGGGWKKSCECREVSPDATHYFPTFFLFLVGKKRREISAEKKRLCLWWWLGSFSPSPHAPPPCICSIQEIILLFLLSEPPGGRVREMAMLEEEEEGGRKEEKKNPTSNAPTFF